MWSNIVPSVHRVIVFYYGTLPSLYFAVAFVHINYSRHSIKVVGQML